MHQSSSDISSSSDHHRVQLSMQVDRFWYGNMTETISASWHYFAGVISLICLLGGVIFNGLVIFVFFKNDALKRPRNYFLINLAVTDIGLLLTNNSMHVISSFRKHWVFGQRGCNFYSICGGVFGLTSIATMAAIAVTRLAAVNDPFSSLKLTSRFTIGCLICTWIYGSIWIMPPLFGWNRFILEGFATSCTFDYISRALWDRIFILILIAGGFLIPLLVILTSYTIILIKLSRRSRDFTDENHRQSTPLSRYNFNQLNLPVVADPQSRISATPTHDPASEDSNISRNLRRTEARATRTALLILTVFCSAWGPYTLMALLSFAGFDYLINGYTTSMLGIFAKVAACINPLVYALSLRGFREQICKYFKYFYRCDSKEHRLLTYHGDLHRIPLDLNVKHRTHSNSGNRLNVV